MAEKLWLRDWKGERVVTSKDEVLANIETRYSKAGFSEAEVECPSGVVFQNAFSVQAVFVVETGDALKEQWPALHEELIGAYRSYQGFVDMEWNFYCVFVVLDQAGLLTLRGVQRTIENDTTYSRKFVLFGDELHLLPPGRFDSGLANASASEDVDPMGEWRSVLGGDLLERVSAATFAELKDVIGDFVEEEAAHGD